MNLDLSIVVPVLNEEESINPFITELRDELTSLKKSYEIIFIDDGSTDATLEVIKKLSEKDKRIRIFSFRKNQGKAEALTLGFQHAQGNYVVTLDADLQDKPSEIKKLLQEINGKWDIVSGWRKERRDKLKTVLSSRMFNGLVRVFWGLELHDYNCGLKMYTNEAAKSLRLYGGMHRFIPLLAYQEGFTITEVPVVHQKRKFGKSKYGFSKIFKDIPDLFTMLFLVKYGKRPLHFFGIIGGLLAFIGGIILVGLFIYQLMGHAIGRRPLLIFGMLLVISGLQIFFTGFIAELLINSNNRIYQHPPLRYASESL